MQVQRTKLEMKEAEALAQCEQAKKDLKGLEVALLEAKGLGQGSGARHD